VAILYLTEQQAWVKREGDCLVVHIPVEQKNFRQELNSIQMTDTTKRLFLQKFETDCYAAFASIPVRYAASDPHAIVCSSRLTTCAPGRYNEKNGSYIYARLLCGPIPVHNVVITRGEDTPSGTHPVERDRLVKASLNLTSFSLETETTLLKNT